MFRRDFLKHVGAGACILSGCKSMGVEPTKKESAVRKPGDRPNIIFIMLDDLGKEWVECTGGEKGLTPNVDKLARAGMRFENAYSMPQCTPTRAALLTGQYPWRNGWVHHWDVPRWGAGCHFDPKHNLTFARVLKSAGYATAIAGKWQINDFRVQPDILKQHGFDSWCMWTGYETGVKASAERYWDAYINTPEGSRTYQGKFGPDVYCDSLIDFMEKHKNEPMMLYFPMALTHGPMTTTPDEPDVSKKYDYHKAMIRYTDKLLGRLVDALERLGIRDNTIIFWTTDNGSGGGFTGTLNGTPVRGGKAKDTESGICQPFIVNCPGLVPGGVVTDALTDFTDMLPTFAELAGVKAPTEDMNGNAIDGKSIAPLILGKAKDSKREWIMAMGHGAASLDEKGVRPRQAYNIRTIRDKRFKLWVDRPLTVAGNAPLALYDLKKDPFEKHNILDSHDPVAVKAREKLVAVAKTFPEIDGRPRYDPLPPQPWDRKMGQDKKNNRNKRTRKAKKQ